MIASTSRYYGGYSGKVLNPLTNEYSPYVYRRFNVPSNTRYNLYTIVEGDRLDTLAYKLYGDPYKWHNLLDLNPDIHDGWELVPGTVIRVPRNA
jgi:nucleoid-associated protein YgaU